MELRDLSPLLWDDVYHVAVVVPDLDRALVEVGRQLGLTFGRQRNVSFRLRDGQGRAMAIEPSSHVRYAYSRGRSPYLELIEAKPEGIWTAEGGARVHHIGVWSDNLPEDVRRLEERGLRTEAIGGPADAEDGRDRFAYLTNDFGMRVELVDSQLRAGLEARLERAAPKPD